MLYDWANSAFATTIMAGFFPIFFKSYWSASDEVHVSTAKLAFSNSLVGIIIALSAPVLGAMADHSGKKNKFLFTFLMLGVGGCVALFFVAKGDWRQAVLLYVLASLGFFSANNIYDSMLTDVVKSEKDYNRVSAGGYSMGYLGGGILFALNVAWTLWPSWFGFTGAAMAVRASFISVGLWWFLFALPLLWYGPQKSKKSGSTLALIQKSFRQIRHTFREIRHMKVLFTFLLAYWLYIDGVDTVVRMAVDYGMSIGFTQIDLITALLVVQFLGFPFTWLVGYLAGKTGTRRMLYYTIFIYIIICIWASFMRSRYEFYGLAFLIASAQGGIQSLSRSFFAGLIPPEKSAEYFGFYNMLGKFAVIFGPLLIGLCNFLLGYVIDDPQTVSRLSMASLLVLFLGGAFTLSLVDEKKAHEEKKYL